MNGRSEVLPAGVTQGLHQVAGKPELDALIRQALAEFVKACGKLGNDGVGHIQSF